MVTPEWGFIQLYNEQIKKEVLLIQILSIIIPPKMIGPPVEL